MTATKRAQIMMEPDDYRRLEEIARRREVSVAELIRTAVRDRYLGGGDASHGAVETICGMSLPVIDWAAAETEIVEGHGDGVS